MALTRSLLALCSIALFAACGGGSGGADSGRAPDTCDNCGAESGQLILLEPNARACEALVEATGGAVTRVEFGDGIAGKAVIEGDRAGISLVSTSGAALPNVAGTLRFDGELRLLKSTCFDAAGAALAGDGLGL
ncbi:MAG: hypothetical protein AAFQ82_03175 [Myxococcota bacterium]